MTDIKKWAADTYYEDGTTPTKVAVSDALAAKGHRPDTANCSAEEENFLLNQLTDRAHLPCDVQQFTVDGPWTKPAHALFVDFELIDPGQPGANGSASTGGGGGGASGLRRTVRVPAALVPTNLNITVPASYAGVHTSAHRILGGVTIFEIAADGTYTGPTNGTGTGGAGGTWIGVLGAQFSVSGASGGAGGAGAVPTGANGNAGAFGTTGKGGDGGTAGTFGGAAATGGKGGRGYGAGGGGGGGANGGGAGGGGGGGGGGGYGDVQLAADGANGDGTRAGGAGAPGLCVITTWFDSEN